MTQKTQRNLAVLATTALGQRLRSLHPEVDFKENGYVSGIEDNLVDGVTLEMFEEDLREGGGHELEEKFRAPHSSSALAVNCFARFKGNEGHLVLESTSGFSGIKFEEKCSTGLRGEPPNLDLICRSDSGVIGIESKCTEYLHEKGAPEFSPAYFERILDERRMGTWFAAMERIKNGDVRFSQLDVAQLIKHAFGLSRSFKGKACTLLYLFWEPVNASKFSAFSDHRRQIQEFNSLVNGGFPKFSAMSYLELWSSWLSGSGTGEWLREHLSKLQNRYLVAL